MPRIEGRLNVFVAVLALLLVLFAPAREAYLMAIVCFGLLGVDAAGTGYLRVIRVPVYFLGPSLLILLVMTAGVPAVTAGPITISMAGIDRTVAVGLRSGSSVAILGYLITTTTIPQLVATLQSVRVPQFALDIAVLTYRVIQVFLDELDRLEQAAAARLGFRTRRTTLRSSKALAISLFISATDRAQTLDTAMQARGYTGQLPTTTAASHGYGYAIVVIIAIAVAGWYP